MKIAEISEAVGDHFLYHHAKPEHFRGIVQDGKIRVAETDDDSGEACTPGTICMTRNREFGAYNRPIMIVINRQALKQTHRVEPATYYLNPPGPQSNRPGEYTRIPRKDYYSAASAHGEEEERTYRDIPFNSRYIVKVVTSVKFEPKISQHLKTLNIPVELRK